MSFIVLNLLLQLGVPVQSTSAAEADPGSRAKAILDLYLAAPHLKEDTMGAARQLRLAVLDQLSRTSNALPVIRSALPAIPDSRQRAELAEIVGRNIQNSAGASLLTELLKDPAPEVRWQAVHGLRLLASRADRSGIKRIVVGPDHPPIVEGLVPALISAAEDPSEWVRVSALFALADARDPQATQEIRRGLKDPSREVRIHAACLLTEFEDASGLREMIQLLERLSRSYPGTDIRNYFEAEMLLASLERITGKSLGEIPLNPLLSSTISFDDPLRKEYRRLLDAWWKFFSSEEGKQLAQKLRRAEPRSPAE
jgi:hypothetical protein